MTGFKRGRLVYDTAGYKYLYSDKASDGHYVNKITLIQLDLGGDFEEIEETGELVFLKNVFARPPKAKMNEEIKKLSAEKTDLSNIVIDLQREERGLRRSIEVYQGKLEKEMSKYPHYKAFLHIAKGGELYRLDCYGNLLNANEATKLSFDVKTGEFDAEVSDKDQYCIVNSGYNVKMFTTLGHAKRFFLSNTKWHEFDANDFSYTKRPEAVAKKYIDLKLSPPVDLNACIKEQKAKQDAKTLNNLQEAVADAKERLENFTAPSA